MNVQLTDTEKRVLRNLHLLGYTGKMGNMTAKKRGELLQGLISKGMLDKNCRPTKAGINANLFFKY